MPHTAFVLAAGFGTRLRPLTDHRPKPLVPVCGVPMLAYALALCARHGLDDVVVNAHWLAGALWPWAGEREGVRVRVVVEAPEILGTGGGLKAVAASLAPRVAVVNADVLCDVDLGALLAAVPVGGAAMAVRPSPEVERYGVVAADADGRVVRMRHVEVPGTAPIARDAHGTGLHALDRDVLARLPDGFCDIVGDAYLDLVREGRIHAVRHPGTWLDVGDPAAYLDANLRVLDGDVAVPLDPHARAAFSRDAAGRTVGEAPGEAHGGAPGKARLVGPVWIGAGARVEGARVERSVVGDGARVAPGARLRRCVVWDGAEVPPGEHEGVVFHDGGALAVG